MLGSAALDRRRRRNSSGRLGNADRCILVPAAVYRDVATNPDAHRPVTGRGARCPPNAFDCHVQSIRRPDLRTIDALATLQLTLSRDGRRLCLHGASDELRRLIALCGLSRIVQCLADDPDAQGSLRLG